jgi:hypothetical protein
MYYYNVYKHFVSEIVQIPVRHRIAFWLPFTPFATNTNITKTRTIKQ